jgi:hypothetical protein
MAEWCQAQRVGQLTKWQAVAVERSLQRCCKDTLAAAAQQVRPGCCCWQRMQPSCSVQTYRPATAGLPHTCNVAAAAHLLILCACCHLRCWTGGPEHLTSHILKPATPGSCASGGWQQ